MAMQYWSKDPTQPDWTPDPGSPCRVMQSESVIHDNFLYGGQIGGYWFGILGDHPVSFSQKAFRLAPLESESDKARKVQESALCKVVSGISLQGFGAPEKYAVPLMYDQGVRVLKTGEAIGRRLSDEDASHLSLKFGQGLLGCSDVIEAVQEHIFGESDDE